MSQSPVFNLIPGFSDNMRGMLLGDGIVYLSQMNQLFMPVGRDRDTDDPHGTAVLLGVLGPFVRYRRPTKDLAETPEV